MTVPSPRVLLIAEAANPEWVSVPLVGWSIAMALRKIANVHLVTQVRNREAIARAGLKEGVDFTVIDNEVLMKPLWKLASALRGGDNGKGWAIVGAVQSLSYPLFERMVWRRFCKRIGAGEFDVVHRVTPLSPTTPSPLAKHCKKRGVPFVVGPINGGVPWPKGFDKERRDEGEWLSYLRPLYKLQPGIAGSWRNASAIIVASKSAESGLPHSAQEKTIFIPENAIDTDRFKVLSDPGRYDHLDMCFIGRLVPCKGLEMALNAAQELLRAGRARFTIVGDGPLRSALERQAEHLGIASSVKFTGWLDHREIPSIAGKSSIFMFPSIREFGGGAVVEAMALGLVPIVVNYGGPGEIVTDTTGFRLSLGSRETITSAAEALLTDIANGRHDLAAIAANGLERIGRLYTWDAKASQLNEVYDWVSGRRADRPTFPF